MKTKKLGPNEVKKLVTRYMEVMEQLDTMKALYGEADELTVALIGQDLSGFGLAVVDNFHSKNTVFKTTAVKRYEIKKVA